MKPLINAILVEPELPCRRIWVENDIHAIQGLVGGPVENVYRGSDPIVILCNGEGMMKDLPLNRVIASKQKIQAIICGPFVILGTNGSEFVNLSPRLMAKYIEKFLMPDIFRKNESGALEIHHFAIDIEEEDNNDN